MKNFLLPLLILILSACASPQVAVTSTASPIPTNTPIPTPTLHPKFIELQNLIDDSGERFTLLTDGTIEELIADSKRQTVPNLHVDQNGIITIIFNNKGIVIKSSEIRFDDEKGLTVKGYELDEKGEWVEAISEAELLIIRLFEKYGIDPEIYILTKSDHLIVATNKETGAETLRSNGFQIWYEIGFAFEIAAKDCEPTDFKPTRAGYMPAAYAHAHGEYLMAIRADLKYQGGGSAALILIDREKQCWASVSYVVNNLLYRDQDDVAHKLPLIPLTDDEIRTFQANR